MRVTDSHMSNVTFIVFSIRSKGGSDGVDNFVKDGSDGVHDIQNVDVDWITLINKATKMPLNAT